MKRVALRPQSRKRQAEQRERRKMIASMLREGPVLCVMCGGRADDLHEVVSRARGGSISSRENTVPLCRRDHDWVTAHPLEAQGMGLSARKED